MDTIQNYPYDAVLGDIGIINGWIVTPNGTAPLQGPPVHRAAPEAGRAGEHCVESRGRR